MHVLMWVILANCQLAVVGKHLLITYLCISHSFPNIIKIKNLSYYRLISYEMQCSRCTTSRKLGGTRLQKTQKSFHRENAEKNNIESTSQFLYFTLIIVRFIRSLSTSPDIVQSNISKESLAALSAFSARTGISFKSPQVLIDAVTHKSFVNRNEDSSRYHTLGIRALLQVRACCSYIL